jgi:hypothetical protein
MRTVFFARVKGSDGTFQTQSGIAANPFNPVANTCTPGRTSAGLYTLVFGNAFPIANYKYTAGLEGAAVNGNAQVSVSTVTATIRTSIGAVATDEDFWVCIEEIGDSSAS